MLCSLRALNARTFANRAFSTSGTRADLAKLTLIGHLVRDPEIRMTKNEREYAYYTVATRNPSGPPDANGERRPSTSTFHRVLCFGGNALKYLPTLKKGSKVYVETSFELREPDPEADPTTPQGQRQILLKHETIRVLNLPKTETDHEPETESY